MKRIVLWAASTLTAVVLLFGYHTSTSGALDAAATPVTPVTGSTSTSSGTSSDGASSGGTGDDTTTQPDPTTSGSTGSGSTGSGSKGASSGTVTGDVAQTRWGPVQVELTVSGGKITDVSVVQYPDNNGRDAEINGYALPILVQETLDQQSADIDMVSGATVTSDGYIGSLQSALDKAGL